jgi:uncharacterized membrane protein YeaQ/YmgE (transglycosylase-associated protein family)
MDAPKGYILTVLGAVAGGFAPSALLTMSGPALNPDNHVYLGLLIFATATMIGWVGAVLGTWAALRLGKCGHAVRTAGFLVAVLLLSWIAITPLMMFKPLALSNAGLTVMNVSIAVLAPLMARALATSRRLFPPSV